MQPGYFKLKRVKQTNKLVVGLLDIKATLLWLDLMRNISNTHLKQQNEIGEVVYLEELPDHLLIEVNPILTR